MCYLMGCSSVIESVPKPVDDIVVGFILSQRRETAELDFKLTLDIRRSSDFAKIAKDMFAMSNYGGGYLVFGYKEIETGSFDPVGLPEDFHVDQATLQEKFNAYSNCPIVLEYREVEKEIEEQKRKFALVYVPPSPTVLRPIKYATYIDRRTGRTKKAFSRDEILIRRGTQSVHASLHEIKFIEMRSKETKYKISLLSGEPDKVKENLYSNSFKVIKWPSHVYEVEIPTNIRFRFFETKDIPYIRHGKKIHSFCNLDQDPFGKYIIPNSLHKYNVGSFLESRDKKNLLVQLFNSEIRNAALKKGLRYVWRNKKVFFYPTEMPERREAWRGRYKKTRKLVVKKIYIRQLKRSLFIHDAALVAFHFIGTEMYLHILPKIVLTHDGYETTEGFREGTVKTRLSYDKYNDSFLNSILFWISRFKALGERNTFAGKMNSILLRRWI